jgi:hypothetical protein
MQESRVKTATRIAWFLDRIGQPSTWWSNVQAGVQNPFEKMQANTGPDAVSPSPPAPAKKKKILDTETLVL